MVDGPRYRRFGVPDASPRERFDYWRTWYAEAAISDMRLEPVAKVPPDFQSSAEVLEIGDISISELHCGPAVGSWTRDTTERADLLRIDIFYRASGVTGHWHDRDVIVNDGCAVLFGGTGGWWRAPVGLRTIQVNVPRALIPVPPAVIDRITEFHPLELAPVFQTLVRPMLLGMVGRLEELSRVVDRELSTVWISLATLLLRSLNEDDTAGRDLAPALRLQARQFIEANLADPRLGPDEVAAALRVSRRSLYQMLAHDGEGVAAAIRRRRLCRARQLLVDPGRRHQPISAIAAEVGLSSAAHFSRLFRAQYGQSPRDVRMKAAGRD
jgi:AraC-like DNA-binding protein